MTSLAEKITRHYGGDWRGTSGNYPGDGHSRRDRSVAIKDAPDAPDGVLVYCHNGEDALAEKDRLRRDGFLPPFERRKRGNNDHGGGGRGSWRCTGVYEYDDGAGQVLYRTKRLECPGEPKRFTAERLVNGQWVVGLGDVTRLPYRFTDLCRAAEQARDEGQPDPLIYFVEGERKADKLVEMGFLATAIAFGCKGWREEYGEAFAGATVIVLPDNDDPGRKFAETVKAGVEQYGGTVYIVELPGLPHKGDIIDWTGTADDLRGLVESAMSARALPLRSLNLADLANLQPAAKTFAVERLAPLAEVTLFTGPGSAGKSLLGQQLATSAAAGLPCLGLSVMAGPALYLTCEDDEDQLHWRQAHICDALRVPMASLAGRLHLVSLRGALDNDLCTFGADGTLTPMPAYHRLVAMLKATEAKLAILDNVAHLFTGNENERGPVTRFANLLNRLALETGSAILLLGHPNKSGDSYSGSTAWINAVRSQFFIDHDRDGDGGIVDPDARVLTVGKANYAQKGEALRFRWHNWAFVLEEDLPSDIRSELSEVIRVNGENAAFMRCLAVCTEKRRAVSHNPGTNYAPAVFAKMPEGRRYNARVFAAAFERLLSIGEIELDQPLWQGDNRHWKRGIKAASNAAPTTAPTPCAEPRQPHD